MSRHTAAAQSAPLVGQRVHIAGDTHVASSFMGAKAAGQITLVYTGRFCHPFPEKEVTCELYNMGDGLLVQTLCVRCGGQQTVRSERKEIKFDKARGTLQIEKFTCPNELDPSRRMEFGINTCGHTVVYDGKVIRDA